MTRCTELSGKKVHLSAVAVNYSVIGLQFPVEYLFMFL